MKKIFSEKLRELINSTGLTAKNYSNKAKISYNTIISLKHNKSKLPTITTLIKIAKFHKITIDKLIENVNFK